MGVRARFANADPMCRFTSFGSQMVPECMVPSLWWQVLGSKVGVPKCRIPSAGHKGLVVHVPVLKSLAISVGSQVSVPKLKFKTFGPRV